METQLPDSGRGLLAAERTDAVAALVSYPAAFVYAELMLVRPQRIGAIVFTLVYLAALAVYCRAKGRGRPTPDALLAAACMCACALAHALFHGQTVLGYDMIFLHGLAVWYALARTERLTDGRLGAYTAFDLIAAAVLVPFSHFFLRIKTLLGAVKRPAGSRDGSRAVGILPAILAAAVLLIAAFSILTRADPLFGEALSSLALFRLSFGTEALALLISLPVGCYLFALAGGSLLSRAPRFSRERVDAAAAKLRAVPDGLACALTACFLLLYALFFGFQGRYLLGAFTGALPQSFTAAEYARQGFFEMCQIVSLNFLLLLGISQTTRTPYRSHRLLRLVTLLLLLSSLLFAAVACSKMALYISRFGLTQLRLAASFFMLLLTIGTFLAIMNWFRPFRAVSAMLRTGLVLFALFCLSNPDARIVEANLALYRTGAVPMLDVEYLAVDCGAAQSPVRFYGQLEEAGYFRAPRTSAELTAAFGAAQYREEAGGATRMAWPDGSGFLVAKTQDGLLVSLRPEETRGW